MKLRVFTSFSGYDSQLMALRDIGADYECVGWSEIDKWAIKAHNAVFPELAGRNYGDITKIDWNAVPNFDLFTYSFPCTDISSAGKQKGFEEDSGTRSSLLWECRRPIAAKHPKFLLMENVKALISEKYRPLFLNGNRGLARSVMSIIRKYSTPKITASRRTGNVYLCSPFLTAAGMNSRIRSGWKSG